MLWAHYGPIGAATYRRMPLISTPLWGAGAPAARAAAERRSSAFGGEAAAEDVELKERPGERGAVNPVLWRRGAEPEVKQERRSTAME